MRELEKQVKYLQLLVGTQAMTIEILEASRHVEKEVCNCQMVQAVTVHPTAAVCWALRTARSTAYLRLQPRLGAFYRREEDREVLPQIMDFTLCAGPF